MILDVGCGNRPRGNVNVDRYIRASLHRGYCNQGRLNLKNKIPNLIRADMNYLPFRNGVFEKVFSDNAIEHTKTPFKALKEMVRVSSDIIEIKCPHRFMEVKLSGRKWMREHHYSYFTRRWFQEFSLKLKLSVTINECTQYYFFPHTYIPILNLPLQLHYVGHKKKAEK